MKIKELLAMLGISAGLIFIGHSAIHTGKPMFNHMKSKYIESKLEYEKTRNKPVKKITSHLERISGEIINERFVEGEVKMGFWGGDKKGKNPYKDEYHMLVQSEDGRKFLYSFHDEEARKMDTAYDVGSKVGSLSPGFTMQKID